MKEFLLAINVPLREIFFSFLFIPTRYVSSLIPKNKNILVFGSWMGKNFSDNPMFFHNYLKKKRKNLKLIVVVNHNEDVINLRRNGYLAFRKYSFKGLYYSLRASVFFITHSVSSDINIITTSSRNNVVNFWHGTPGKKLNSLGYLNTKKKYSLKKLYNVLWMISSLQLPKFTYFIATNVFAKNIFQDVFHLKKESIKVLGYPRNDIFFNSKQKNLKDILYLPTYRSKLSLLSPILNETNLNKLNKLLKKKKYRLIIKAHPAIKNKFNIKNKSNIFLFKDVFTNSNIDAQRGMEKSDVLITDYSGILYDYFLTNRPIIFFPYDLDSYKLNPGLQINYLKDLPGPFAFNIEEMIELISSLDIWSKNEKYLKRYQKFKMKYNKYDDCKSSERLLLLLEKDKIII